MSTTSIGVSGLPLAAAAAHSSSPVVGNSPAGHNRRAAVRNMVARGLPAPARSRLRQHRRRPHRRQRMAKQAGPDHSAIPIRCTSTVPMPQTSAGVSRLPLKGPQPQCAHNAQLVLPYSAVPSVTLHHLRYTGRTEETCPAQPKKAPMSMARANLPALHIRPVGDDPVPPQHRKLVRLGIDNVLPEFAD
jgi:hypothetical protein